MKTHPIILLAVVAIMLGASTTSVQADGKVVVPDELQQRVETEGWSQQWHDELYNHEDPKVGLALRHMLRTKRDAEALKSGLVVHEWGSMQHHLDTDTSEFDLMGEDRSDLPPFVKVLGDQPMRGPHLMRKPIIYFYTQQKQKVVVTARFPEGVLTQWYPDVTHFAPQRDSQFLHKGQQPQAPRNGVLSWQQVELNPATDASLFAAVNANHPWWHIARDTDATPVRVIDKRNAQTVERFLFYRGAGSYKPMVMPKRDKPGVDLSVRVPFSQIDLRGVFLVRVNDSGATITHAPVLRAEGTMTLAGPDAIRPTKEAAAIAKDQLIESLEAAGLFPKEAAGLVKIWGDDMFTTPGERLLYLMPNNEVERVLPLDIQPEPKQLVRTLIAWVELSTPEAEKRIMDLIKQLSSKDPAQALAANKELRKLDRFAEAILRRTLDTIKDAQVKTKIKQILTALEQHRRQGKRPSPFK